MATVQGKLVNAQHFFYSFFSLFKRKYATLGTTLTIFQRLQKLIKYDILSTDDAKRITKHSKGKNKGFKQDNPDAIIENCVAQYHSSALQAADIKAMVVVCCFSDKQDS